MRNNSKFLDLVYSRIVPASIVGMGAACIAIGLVTLASM